MEIKYRQTDIYRNMVMTQCSEDQSSLCHVSQKKLLLLFESQFIQSWQVSNRDCSFCKTTHVNWYNKKKWSTCQCCQSFLYRLTLLLLNMDLECFHLYRVRDIYQYSYLDKASMIVLTSFGTCWRSITVPNETTTTPACPAPVT